MEHRSDQPGAERQMQGCAEDTVCLLVRWLPEAHRRLGLAFCVFTGISEHAEPHHLTGLCGGIEEIIKKFNVMLYRIKWIK